MDVWGYIHTLASLKETKSLSRLSSPLEIVRVLSRPVTTPCKVCSRRRYKRVSYGRLDSSRRLRDYGTKQRTQWLAMMPGAGFR
jgi:hypothetical protein